MAGVLKVNVGGSWVPITVLGTNRKLPAGGQTGQVLTKRSAADNDVQWSGPGNTQYIADTGWNEIGTAGKPAFQNSWVNYGGGFNTAAYRVDADGWVWLKGLITGGGVNSVICTLPVGYRPWKTAFSTAMSQDGMNAYVQVNTDGTVIGVQLGGTANGWLSIEQMRFPLWNTWAQHYGRYFPLEGLDCRASYGEWHTGMWPQINGMTRLWGISGALSAAGSVTKLNDLNQSIYSYMFGVATADTAGGKGCQVSKKLGLYINSTGSSWTMFSTEFGTLACENQWIAPALVNGWANIGPDASNWHAPAGYWKDNAGVVHLRGTLVSGSSATATMFTLPVGYRPAGNLMWTGLSASGANCRVEVHSDGVVMGWTGASTTWTCFNGMHFYAAGA
jgi:hypothetical protein